MKTALAQAGDMQIELIQPTGNSPSAYRDTVPMGRSGFHHIVRSVFDTVADAAIGWDGSDPVRAYPTC